MDCREEFGKMMREARKARGMTAKELADQIGISSVYCREIEHGRYSISWVTWLKICTTLGIDANSVAEILMAGVESD